MIVNVCPSTLAAGYKTYSPKALKDLFGGVQVSHLLDFLSPANKSFDTRYIHKNVGRLSLSGVQPKFSMTLDNGSIRYTNEAEPGTFIAKPSPTDYHLLNRRDCPANENLTMQMASQVYKLDVAANGLAFYLDEEPVYITRRFDYGDGHKLKQEDFASLMGVTKAHGGSDYKYCNGSYQECGDIIRQYVKSWMVDVLKFFRVILYNFLTLNDDAHLKNFSLIQYEGEYHLAPAYDLVNTSLHLNTPKIFALDRGLFKEGMDFSDVRSVRRADFAEFGRRLGLPPRLVEKELDRFSKAYPAAKQLIFNSFLSDENKELYWLSFDYRRKMLSF